MPTSPSGRQILNSCLPERTICRREDAPKHGARTGKLKILLYNPDNGARHNFLRAEALCGMSSRIRSFDGSLAARRPMPKRNECCDAS